MKRQRGFIGESLLPWIIGGVAVAAIAGWLWWQFEHRCNKECLKQKDIAQAAILRVGTLEEAIAVAQKRATDLALLWSDAINQERTVYVKVVEYRDRVFTRYRDRAASVGVSGRITLAADASRLLGDIARASNEAGTGAAAAGGDSKPAEAVPDPAGGEVVTDSREWIAFAVAAADAYADAAGKHKACVEAYGRIREATP